MKLIPTFSLTILPLALGAQEIKTTENLLNFVRSNYVAPAVLNEKILNESLFWGLKNYLGEGFEVSSTPLNQTPSLFSSFREVWLKQNLIWQFGVKEGAMRSRQEHRLRFQTYLKEDRLNGLILDFREWRNFFRYEDATQFLSWWIKPDTLLFGFKRPLERWYRANGELISSTLPLVIIVNQNTLGVGEVIAEVLRQQKRAILIGSNTGGGMVSWIEKRGMDNLYYRVANERIFLPENRALFPGIVKPDLEVSIKADLEKVLLEEERRVDSLNSYVFEQEKQKKNNEAALSRGDYSPEENGKESQEKEVLQDQALQMAVDYLDALSLWQKL